MEGETLSSRKNFLEKYGSRDFRPPGQLHTRFTMEGETLSSRKNFLEKYGPRDFRPSETHPLSAKAGYFFPHCKRSEAISKVLAAAWLL